MNVRKDFPILEKIIYLDSGATTQKPRCVIDAIQKFYLEDNANIHRGVYELSQRATKKFEHVREQVKNFIHAEHSHEIIFTRGTTESINLVAQCLSHNHIQKDDEILISAMEHHSNIVPWQLIAEKIGAKIKVIPITDLGEIELESFRKLFTAKTKMVAVTHVSNVLGTVNPIKEMIRIAHENNVPVLVDGAQAVPHLSVNVTELDCDFYAFSSHKMYGPTGVGVLYGKTEWLKKMPPYQGGGDMIERVSFEKTTYNKLPYKFEAGTPDISNVIGLGVAIDYLNQIGMHAITEHEKKLLAIATEELKKIPELKIFGESENKIGVISFTLNDIHPHDIGTILDHENIAVRAGHHCAMPLMQRFNVPAMTRISFGIYNTEKDIENLIKGLKIVHEVFHERIT